MANSLNLRSWLIREKKNFNPTTHHCTAPKSSSEPRWPQTAGATSCMIYLIGNATKWTSKILSITQNVLIAWFWDGLCREVHRMGLGLSLQVLGLALMRPVRVFVGGEEKAPSQRWSYWAWTLLRIAHIELPLQRAAGESKKLRQ